MSEEAQLPKKHPSSPSYRVIAKPNYAAAVGELRPGESIVTVYPVTAGLATLVEVPPLETHVGDDELVPSDDQEVDDEYVRNHATMPPPPDFLDVPMCSDGTLPACTCGRPVCPATWPH